MVKLICGDIGQSFQDNRVAAIHYSDFVYEDFAFNTSFLVEEVVNNIHHIPKNSGSTCTGDAFNYARVVMLQPEKGRTLSWFVIICSFNFHKCFWHLKFKILVIF